MRLEGVEFSGYRHVGGLAGKNDGTIISSYATGSVSGKKRTGDNSDSAYIGGLVGRNFGTINSSYASTSVSGTETLALGGLVGESYGQIINSYASGSVSGNGRDGAGGLVGTNYSAITKSYATGHVSGDNMENTGGLVGYNFSNNPISSFYDSGTTTPADEGKGVGKITDEMKLQSTYSDWDFESEWYLLPNQYPQLWAFTSLSQGSAPGTTRLNHVAEGMEYSVDGESFTPITGTSIDNIVAKAGNTMIIRLTGDFPGVKIVTIEPTDIKSITFAGGDGTINNPYQIATAAQLDMIRDYLQASLYYQLVDDINLADDIYLGEYTNWKPIGGEDSPFYGTLDGNGHRITGLTINRPNENYVGLFGRIGLGSSITNMKLANVNAIGYWVVGGLVGKNDGSITNVMLEDVQITGSWLVAGLAGVNTGTISHSAVTGNVNGSDTVGGLVGENDTTTAEILNSYAIVDVSGEDCIGGLVGRVLHGGAISSSYATGSVNGTRSNVGGLVGANGLNGDYPGGTISNSYTTGLVTGAGVDNVGGLVGLNLATVSNSFYSDSTEQNDEGKGIAKTTADMKEPSTYADPSWDFATTWAFDSSRNNGYPILRSFYVSLTYDGNGNTAGNMPTTSAFYTSGETVEVLDLVKDGYSFVGWNTSSDGSGMNYAASETFTITMDIKLYAQWTLNTYRVSFDVDGGSEVAGMNVDYDTVITASIESPSKTNYEFAGWYKENLETLWVFGSDKVLGDTTLYANWTPKKYDVNFDSNGGDLVAKVNAGYDTTITAPTEPSKTNYEFAGWY